MSVDLPAPFSPTKACTSPLRRSNETLSSAFTPGKLLETFSTSRITSCVGDEPLIFIRTNSGGIESLCGIITSDLMLESCGFRLLCLCRQCGRRLYCIRLRALSLTGISRCHSRRPAMGDRPLIWLHVDSSHCVTLKLEIQCKTLVRQYGMDTIKSITYYHEKIMLSITNRVEKI
jgi:hypothetical protein